MALKRREGRSYDVDEMMSMLNKEFIERGTGGADEDSIVYVISSTCFQDDNKRFLVCDSRDNNSKQDEGTGWLEPFYGANIIEAVTKAFVNKNKHG